MTTSLAFVLSILHSWPNRIVAFFLFLFIVLFVVQFFVPAFRLKRKLNRAIARLKAIKEANEAGVVDLEAIAGQAMAIGNLQHLWSEYAETLHGQTKINEMGQEQVFCWRATVMAETFFTEQVLVDTPLKTEFFKHLPGILTGLGIIGTFSGLIQGLFQFEVTDDPAAVRACLSNLVQGVGHAFFISATAIGLAMLLTWIEKYFVTGRYRQVEELNQLIDSLFSAGAGEEYLARLVKSSETSATQSMQLKDALVSDLREILVEITTRQVEASVQNSQQMSQDLARVFTDSIRVPMDRISDAASKLGSSQGDAVNQMLTDVLANFSSQMQEMFGGQLQGTADLLSQTNNAMLGTVAKFDQLAINLQNAGQGTADAMAERLQEAMTAMERRQGDMTHQMSQFVQQMQTISQTSQTEASQQLQDIMNEVGGIMTVIKKTTEDIQQNTAQANREALESIGRQVQTAVVSLQEQAQQAEKLSSDRQSQLAEHSTQLLSELTAQVETLGQRVTKAAEATSDSSIMVASAAKSSIERMNTGADALLFATSELSDAEKRVAGTMKSMEQVAQGLQSSATSLNLAGNGVQGAFKSYQATNEVFASLLETLQSTVETAKHEASVSVELVNTLGNAAGKLAEAQQEAERYLEGVTNVLGEAHEAFAEKIQKTLRDSNSTFQQELTTAVNHLKSGIQDLGDAMNNFDEILNHLKTGK